MLIACPECGYQIDAFAAVKWGDGVQLLKICPLICAGCAEKFVLEIDTQKILDVPPAGWDLIRRRNPQLWEAISRAQEQVRVALKETQRFHEEPQA